MKYFGVIFYLCVFFLDVSLAYKAGILQVDKEISSKEFSSFVYEARKAKVDILVLPSLEPKETLNNFDETVRVLSNAAKDAGSYIVAALYQKINCQNVRETIKSNLVFNRKGATISEYRKPVSNLANCTSTPSELVTFTTDFGVTFGLLMDEDIVLHNVEYLKGLKNFVMTVANKDDTVLNGDQLSSSWSYVNNANLISSKGIYIGKSGLRSSSNGLVTAVIDNKGVEVTVPLSSPISFSPENLRQYTTKPLDLTASVGGYKDTVCYRSFCCEFFVKTGDIGLKPDVLYSFAAFDGIYPLTAHHKIGVQNCAVIACAGETSNGLRPTNNTNIMFERISIAANFTKPNVQYPLIYSSSMLPTEKFKFETNTDDVSKLVTLEVVDGQNVMNVGIFGRDFSKDYESYALQRNNSENTYDIYDLIFNEDIQGFFDYVWIRLRILIVVVSIYVLEMM